MKNLTLGLTIASLSLAAMGQDMSSDKPMSNDNQVTITAPAIQMPDQTYSMDRSELNKFKGWYELSNGGELSLFSQRGVLYAQVEGQPQHEIVATTPDTFVAKDLQLKLVLDQDVDTNEGDVVVGRLIMAAAPQYPTNNNVSSN
jgi:hypothetical protein